MTNSIPGSYQAIQPHYTISGNVPIQHANLIWVLETPKKLTREWNASLINCIFREVPLAQSPLVLLEGFARGKRVPPRTCGQTSLLEKQNLPTQGWDLPEFIEQINNLYKREGRLDRLATELGEKMNAHQLKETAALLDQFWQFVPKKGRTQTSVLLNLVKKRNFSAATEVFNKAMDAFDKSHVEKTLQVMGRNFQARQKSLMSAIQEGTQSHGIVILYTGTAHAIRSPLYPGIEFDLTKMEQFLKTQKFVMVSLKDPQFPLDPMPWLWTVTVNPKHSFQSLSILRLLCDYLGDQREFEAVVSALGWSSEAIQTYKTPAPATAVAVAQTSPLSRAGKMITPLTEVFQRTSGYGVAYALAVRTCLIAEKLLSASSV